MTSLHCNCDVTMHILGLFFMAMPMSMSAELKRLLQYYQFHNQLKTTTKHSKCFVQDIYV